MENLQTFKDFLKDELNEKSGNIEDQVYNALGELDQFKGLGADQQGELVKLVIKQLNKWGIK